MPSARCNGSLTLPIEADYAQSVYHLYVIRAEARDGLQTHLQQAGIATGVHYPVPVHLQPAYRDLGYRRGDFPVTERCAAQLLSLPMYPELTKELISSVVNTVENFIIARSPVKYVAQPSV